MRIPGFKSLLLLSAFSILTASAQAQGPQSGMSLLAEGDLLADQSKYTEALARYKEGYEKILPGLRGLQFNSAVEPKFMERSELQAHMQTLFNEDMTEDELALSDASLRAFGFVPDKFQLKEAVLGLYSEEVAGFYDPKRKQMYLIKEVETPGEKPGLIARLLGIGTGFNKDEQKTTLSHEMSHALADQNFDLLKMQDVAEKDDDRSLALQALIEGEATLVMMLDMERATGGTGRDLLDASPALIDFSLSLASAFIPFASSNAFLQAPPILRESMLFPYFKGMVFLLHMTNDSGWGRVNEAFRKPPLSTEQVLHPEKYLREVDEPTEIVLPPLGDVLGSGWKEVGQNVLGELQISILLRMQQGVRAAAGWDGDRYAVFSGPGNKLGMVWYSTWDSDAEAREFASAYSRYRSLPPDSTEVVVLNPVPDHVRVEQQGRLYDMTRRNSDVVTIEGFSVEETEKLVQTLFTASKRAKK